MLFEDEVEFPCGIKIKRKIKSSIYQTSDGSQLSDYTCPLHGKGCKKNKR